jgi:Tfp pilus assembly protein PilE
MKWKLKKFAVKNDRSSNVHVRHGFIRRGRLDGADSIDEAGLSAVEIVLVVLAGLILLTAAIVIYQKFQRDNELSDALAGLQQLTAGIEEEYQGQSSYTGLTPSLVIHAHLAPQSFVSGTSLENPWSGAGSVNVAPATQGYDITFTGVPQYACAALGKQNLGNLLSVTINGTTLTPNTSTPPTPANVDSACTNGSNTLVWNIN